jgi:hypothetical protein
MEGTVEGFCLQSMELCSTYRPVDISMDRVRGHVDSSDIADSPK